jgi:phenylalanyl-tRNA synthetase beta chain
MPLVSFDYHDFTKLLGHKISKEDLIEKLPMIGGDFDSFDGDTINIEFFPNRPDLTSVEGIVRASRAFFGFELGLTKYETTPSDVNLIVDPSVKKVRPFVVTALVKNITMSDELIRSLMDLQEKLHFGLGRNRKKVAIGVHNFEPVKPPFTYKAVDPDVVEFVPLAKTESMTLKEILTKHEKGTDYAHLLSDFDRYPLIVDSNNNVLSFPPIINGSLTEVTPYTKDVFIDVTGTDQKAIQTALNIVVTALAERGGKVFTTTIIDAGKTVISPDFTPKKMDLSISYVNKILGTQLTEPQIIDCLGKMGYTTNHKSTDTLQILIPSWRSDILHQIDLVEDVAVGYGFGVFQPEFSKTLTFGKTLPQHQLHESLRTIMIGLGFNEVTTFTISNDHDEFINMGLPKGNIVEIENPIGEEYSGLRTSLLPSLLKLLRENRHHSLPQQIFELGSVVDEQAKNRYHLAGIKVDAKANFTDCKSLVEAILRDSGCQYSLQEKMHSGFIDGRCASIISDKKEIGYFGEFHPKTIQTFSLEHPMIAFELFVNLF